jgi:hypothetical protein
LEKDVERVTGIMKKHLEMPIKVGERVMVIPAEVHVGKTWKEAK